MSALESLAPHLNGALAKAAFKAALSIAGDPAMRARATVAVAPMLDGHDRDQALETALKLVLAVDNPWARARALARLVPFLAGDAKGAAREQALQAALSLRNIDGYIEPATPLAALAPELAGEPLRLALLGLLSVQNTMERTRAFEECQLPAQGPAFATVRLALTDQLLASRTLQRSELLQILALPVFAPPFLSSGTVEAVARTTIEICWHWSWQ
jgi:hypothetical protein